MSRASFSYLFVRLSSWIIFLRYCFFLFLLRVSSIVKRSCLHFTNLRSNSSLSFRGHLPNSYFLLFTSLDCSRLWYSCDLDRRLSSFVNIMSFWDCIYYSSLYGQTSEPSSWQFKMIPISIFSFLDHLLACSSWSCEVFTIFSFFFIPNYLWTVIPIVHLPLCWVNLHFSCVIDIIMSPRHVSPRTHLLSDSFLLISWRNSSSISSSFSLTSSSWLCAIRYSSRSSYLWLITSWSFSSSLFAVRLYHHNNLRFHLASKRSWTLIVRSRCCHERWFSRTSLRHPSSFVVSSVSEQSTL